MTAAPPPPTAGWVQIARIRRPVGVEGWLRLQLFTDFPERFAPGAAFIVAATPEPAAEQAVRQTVVAVRHEQRDTLEVRFVGVDDRDAAARFNGQWLLLPLAERQPAAADCYYPDELAGLAVLDPDGAQVGEVAGFEDHPGNPCLAVTTAGGEVTLPFRKVAIAQVDRAGRCLRLRQPLARWRAGG